MKKKRGKSRNLFLNYKRILGDKKEEGSEMKTESMRGGLWFTSGRRIVLDDHSNETFCEPYDKKLMTKEELSKGIKLEEFMKRMVLK